MDSFFNSIIQKKSIGFSVFGYKVRYISDVYYMAGNQFGFKYKDIDHNYNLNYLDNNVISSIQRLFDVYNLTDDEIVYIQISFRQID